MKKIPITARIFRSKYVTVFVSARRLSSNSVPEPPELYFIKMPEIMDAKVTCDIIYYFVPCCKNNSMLTNIAWNDR